MTTKGYESTVIVDSAGAHGVRLTTLALRFPRILLASLSKYGTLAISARSSRAVRTETLIAEVENDPFVPAEWRTARKGMTAGEPLHESVAQRTADEWRSLAAKACRTARWMAEVVVAKQHVNRLLEPFAWQYAVVTGTGDRFAWLFEQRIADDAQPEFQTLARLMRDAMAASTPTELGVGEWHLPYLTPHDCLEVSEAELVMVAAARCARVSYAPWVPADFIGRHQVDVRLGQRLRMDGHFEPFQHPAMCCRHRQSYGKHLGWISQRHRMGE